MIKKEGYNPKIKSANKIAEELNYLKKVCFEESFNG